MVHTSDSIEEATEDAKAAVENMLDWDLKQVLSNAQDIKNAQKTARRHFDGF